MFKKTAWASVIISLVAIPTLGAISFGAAPAEAAVVYCKAAGVPQGCVVRAGAPVGRRAGRLWRRRRRPCRLHPCRTGDRRHPYRRDPRPLVTASGAGLTFATVPAAKS